MMTTPTLARPRPPAHRNSSDRTIGRTPLASVQQINDSPKQHDHAWLGDLQRAELEQLVIEAGRKIQEREQKLLIAANIGKALLDKNLALRSRITASASHTDLDDMDDLEGMVPPASPAWSNTDLIMSTPSSPTSSISSPARVRSRLLHHQLTLLGSQNDMLHHQISELQREADDAKRDGSRMLSKLNKEMRGLKAELDAATKRNSELESSASTLPSNRFGTQLLVKIKELEQTTAVMATAEEDLGSRIGRAMQEDERLRDAYNAVDEALVHTADTAIDSSPRRRAPGNRHIIQTRSIIRTAIQRAGISETITRSSTQSSLGTYSIDLSADSSSTSSPQRKSLARKTSSMSVGGRPRIRITPSMEDIGRRAQSVSASSPGPSILSDTGAGSLMPPDAYGSNSRNRVNGARSRSVGAESPTRASSHQSKTPSPLSVVARQRAWSFNSSPAAKSPAALLWKGKTLSSELGSIFGGDDRKNDFDDDDLSLLSNDGAMTLWRQDLSCNGRPTASRGRLVPECTEEHQEDLDCVYAEGSPMRLRDDGDWLSEQGVGALKDNEEPKSSEFDLIAAINHHRGVRWADDDDYGMPITEQDAVDLGLQLRQDKTRLKMRPQRTVVRRRGVQTRREERWQPTTPLSVQKRRAATSEWVEGVVGTATEPGDVGIARSTVGWAVEWVEFAFIVLLAFLQAERAFTVV